MKRNYVRFLAACLLALISQSGLYATHIVGGNITYKCLGANTYEVSVTVRRDCFNGDPEAFFDNPASIGIFDINGQLLTQFGTKGQLLMRLRVNDTLLDPITESLCSIDGTRSVCIHETKYSGTITLPFRPGGYLLMYQRCCRNIPVQNITQPLETGASWIVHLNEEGMTTCNSTPTFKNWSPIFICAGRTYDFDHGAVDPDGDSLVYKMWTPFTGATKAFPKPQPPNKPDFNPISWISPYKESDMLGGDPLKIDSKTGKLFAVPNTAGQFLIGVMVEEYRDGKLLSTVYRDYEIKVVDCGNLVDGKIIAPTLQCDNLTVEYKQESINAKAFKWFFDFDRNKNATSTEANPIYKYTDTGTYKVVLVVTKDSTCFDTAVHIITVKSSKATSANFVTKAGNCVNGNLTLSLIDISTGVAADAKYKWTIKYNGQTLILSVKNPTISIPNGVVATVTLEISEDGNGCLVTSTKTFVTSFIQPEYHRDQAIVCTGDTTKINFILADSIKGRFNYVWDPSPLILSGANTAEPVISSKINQSIYLYVTVDNKNGCTSRDSILIISRTKPKLDFIFSNVCGSLEITVKNNSDQLTDYLFDFGDSTTSTLREPNHTYKKAGKYTVTLSTSDGCAPKLSKTFNIGDFKCLELKDSVNGCIGLPVKINPRANPNYTYKWRPTVKLDNVNSDNPTFVVDSPRIFIADICDKNTGIGLGTLTISVKVPVSDQIKAIKDTVLACAGVGVGLNPGGNPNLKYEWSPAQFLDNATKTNPIATVNGTTVFSVKVTNPADSCVLSKNIVVVIPSKLAIDLIPDSLEACIIVPIALNPNGKPDPNLKYSWSPGRLLDDSTKLNPVATITSPTTFTVTISDTRFDNCMISKSVKVKIPLIEEGIKVLDSVSVCAGVATPINPNGDSRFKYEWSPATGLDNASIANPKATINQTTTYTVKITDTQRGNCMLTKSVKVKVAPPFTVVPSYKDTVSCTIKSFLLSVKSDNPKVKFEWFDGATSVSKNDTVTVSPRIKTIYRVVGTDENGCQKSDSVRVDPAGINLDAMLVGNGLVCEGDSIRLRVIGDNPGQTLSYEWSPKEFIISGGTTNNPTVKPPVGNTTFTVKVSNTSGCMASDTVNVSVKPNTPVTTSANPTTIPLGQTSQITSTVVPGYIYKWTPVEGLDNPNIPNPIAKPKQTTTYTLMVTSPDGCIQTRQVIITVTIPECAEPFIFIPNAFTPNGDGKNDVLFVRSNIVDRMTLIIYDRWGEKVFETNNQNVGWDGTYKGKILNPDVYGYYLVVDCIDGQRFTKKGNVTILK